MSKKDVRQTISQLREWLNTVGYSKGYISHFNYTTDQLIKFMDLHRITTFTIMIGLQFLKEKHQYDPEMKATSTNAVRLRFMQMLSEFQLHDAVIPKARVRTYVVPAVFQEATTGFLAHRRFTGIIERNMSTVQLYLERFFYYISGQNVTDISQISIVHIHGFLKFLAGFSKQTGSHMLRTVRQFLEFCYKNGYHPDKLSDNVPNIHYEKRSNIPSVYSREDVMKLLAQVDRNNPIGKRNYAILLLTAKLGIRSGDICNLKFENIDWEQNKISLVQHKTGRPIVLPLPEDVGLAIIDYLKFGRPKCDSHHIFIRHTAPIGSFVSSSIYRIVSGYISKAGLLIQGKKRGPHALRHSLASRLLEENVPLPVISEILGHADTNTTAVYLSIDINKLLICALEVC